jgi:hypothetical protein
VARKRLQLNDFNWLCGSPSALRECEPDPPVAAQSQSAFHNPDRHRTRRRLTYRSRDQAIRFAARQKFDVWMRLISDQAAAHQRPLRDEISGRLTAGAGGPAQIQQSC